MRATLPEALYDTRKRVAVGILLAVLPIAPMAIAVNMADDTESWVPGAVLLVAAIPLVIGIFLVCWVPRRPAEPGSESNVTPGWYPDRSMVNTMRYWDGQQWTEQTQMGVPRSSSVQPWQIAVAVCAGLALFVLLFGGL